MARWSKEGWKSSWWNRVEGKSTQQRGMEEAAENSKESSHCAHINEWMNEFHIFRVSLWSGVAQSVQRLSTSWTVQGSRFSAAVQSGPGAVFCNCHAKKRFLLNIVVHHNKHELFSLWFMYWILYTISMHVSLLRPRNCGPFAIFFSLYFSVFCAHSKGAV